MVPRMLTLCAAISSAHWLLTGFLSFCIQCENSVVTAQLMSATKPMRTFNHLAISRACTFCLRPGRKPPKTCFLASELNNDFLHICVNDGADQLRGNCTARAADQRFCFRFIGNIPLCTFRVGTAFA